MVHEQDETSTADSEHDRDNIPGSTDIGAARADLGETNVEITGRDDIDSEAVDLHEGDAGESDWNSWVEHVEVPTGAVAERSMSEPGGEVSSMGSKANEGSTPIGIHVSDFATAVVILAYYLVE